MLESSILLPDTTGKMRPYSLKDEPIIAPKQAQPFNRIAFSAAHVVVNPFSANEPSQSPDIDWDKTMEFRRYLLGLGLGIAESMDTAQRGMGLDWNGAYELIKRTLEETSDIDNALIFNGCGTDQLMPEDAHTLDDVIAAYMEQLEAIQKLGGRIILMASRALAKVATSTQDYVKVYNYVLSQCDQPVILHWLGDMFDPALKGYWGATTFEDSLEIALQIIDENVSKVDGIKISLLDAQKEITMRRRLPASVKMYTGDDFNYPELIEGDEQGFSHALLGIFDPIAPAAAAALHELASGNNARFQEILAPTVPLSRLIFRSPTQYYKSGVVFLAYLNGFQDHFIMMAGHQAMRPLPYYIEIFQLADQAGLLRDSHLACDRMKRFLSIYISR